MNWAGSIRNHEQGRDRQRRSPTERQKINGYQKRPGCGQHFRQRGIVFLFHQIYPLLTLILGLLKTCGQPDPVQIVLTICPFLSILKAAGKALEG